MCRKKNYRRVRRTFVESKCKDKATKIGNSNPQGWVVEYGGKSKGAGESNTIIGKWTNFSKGSGWMNF